MKLTRPGFWSSYRPAENLACLRSDFVFDIIHAVFDIPYPGAPVHDVLRHDFQFAVHELEFGIDLLETFRHLRFQGIETACDSGLHGGETFKDGFNRWLGFHDSAPPGSDFISLAGPGLVIVAENLWNRKDQGARNTLQVMHDALHFSAGSFTQGTASSRA